MEIPNRQDPLEEAFNRASFFVRINDESNDWILVKIGIPCPEVAKFADFKPWAIITAYNPGAKQVSDDENLKQHQRFDAETLSFRRLESYGTGDGWPKEYGFFLIDISLEQADSLAKKYGQVAFVFGTQVPKLIWTK